MVLAGGFAEHGMRWMRFY